MLEFTGGEPTLAVDLIRDVIRYFRKRLWSYPRHPWQTAYMTMIATNGTTYDSLSVQELLWENRERLYPAITVDGCRAKHDRSRVFADGRGSYDVVERNAKLWVRQYPNAMTKITFSKGDLPFVCESVVNCWELGIRNVAANLAFEPAWTDEDAELYESQLRQLADKAIEGGYWRKYKCNLFWQPSENGEALASDQNWCGAGRMIAVDAEGDLFPCLRFQQFSQTEKPQRSIGSVASGIDADALRPFLWLRRSVQSPEMCLSCQAAEQCSWCTAHNYSEADSDTIFQRMTSTCEMHKARRHANEYYWATLAEEVGTDVLRLGRRETERQ